MSDLRRKIKRAFGFWTGLLAGIAAVLFLSVVVVSIPKWQVQRDLRADRISWSDVPQQENEYRKTLIQIAGGVVVGIGLYLTWRRINATEEAQVTDRFSEAVEQLGDPSLEVRLGGIYALERIAEDSPRDHWTVMETLSAFVRENASSSGAGDLEDPEDGEEGLSALPSVSPDTDVQAACTVIGRRRTVQDPDKRIDLKSAHLAGVGLSDAELSKAILLKANLSEAFLIGVDLSEAELSGGDLSEAILKEVDLSEANFLKTKLSGAKLSEVDLSGADLWKANLSGAKLSKVDLSGAHLGGADLTGAFVENSALFKARTLYEAQLDPDVEEAVRKQSPDLLEKPQPEEDDSNA